MKKIVLLFFAILFPLQISNAQKIEYQQAHMHDILNIILSPTNKKLLSYSHDDGICLWDLQTNQLIWKKNITFVQKGEEYYTLTSFDFSPDEKFIASGSGNGTVQLWDTENGNLIWRSDAHENDVSTVKFSPDGKFIASAATPRNFSNEIKLLSSSDGKFLKRFEVDKCFVIAMKFSDNEKILKAGKIDGKVMSWDLQTGKQMASENAKPCIYPRYAGEVSFSDDLRFSAMRTDEKELTVKNTENDSIIKKFPVSNSKLYSKFGGNNQKIVISTYGGFLIYDFVTGEIQETNEVFLGDEFLLNFDGSKLIKDGTGKEYTDKFIEVRDLKNPKNNFKLIGGKIAVSPFTGLEKKLLSNKEIEQTEIAKRLKKREAEAKIFVEQNGKKITAKFSHYGNAESFWDQKIAESGTANKSKLKLPKEKAKVAWFTLTNDADLPVSIDTNSMIFNPKCKGLCNGAEISSRYVLELKNGETNVNGFDMFSKTILPPKTTVYFSVALDHFAESKAIYLGFTFQKDNTDDEHSNDYGTEQKLYLCESDLPK